MTLCLISHDSCTRHAMGAGHPESPQRLHAITGHLRRTGLAAELRWQTAQRATTEQICAAHPASHLQDIQDKLPAEGLTMLDGDTLLCPDSLEAALHAAGAAVQAVDLVMEERADKAFCAVRPPGHHAEQAQSMGFCVFNNVAVGVHHALQRWNVQRAAVLDFDVHHGNGTVDIFRDKPDVLVCSSFQHPFYPGRHHDLRRENIVNTPLPAGTGSTKFRKAIEKQWIRAIDAHQPEFLFVSAGFDAHREDPLAQLELADEDFLWLGTLIRDLAKDLTGGRVVALLEGGYHLDALARSTHAFIEGLDGL